MEAVVTPAAMAEADRRTIAAGTPEEVLVERAGRAVAWEVRRLARGRYGHRVLVVCGKGNNGADGMVAARVLRGWGMSVTQVALGELDRSQFERALRTAHLAVDAMFGTGLRTELDGDAAWVADRLSSWAGTTIAVDIPSGVDGTTGAVGTVAVRAGHTVTFAARKPGLLFEPGRSHAGRVTVADIGIDLGPDGGTAPPLALVGRRDAEEGVVRRPPAAHKWFAAVAVVGGAPGLGGAPMLTSRGAMRAGAGMVWCWLPEGVPPAASGSEVITRTLPAHGLASTEAVHTVVDSLSRFGALALGPGLGIDPEVRQHAVELLARAPIPVVLDADGLNALDGDLLVLRRREAPTVLTPHDGEYARMAGASVGGDRVGAARQLAETTGAVVVLKGPGTVVAAPDGRAAISVTGTSALATAGTGDVLTGIVAAFLARGADPFRAACAAAWVHGDAGDRAASWLGGASLVASDLLVTLPRSLRALEAPDRGRRRPGHDDPPFDRGARDARQQPHRAGRDDDARRDAAPRPDRRGGGGRPRGPRYRGGAGPRR